MNKKVCTSLQSL